MDKGLIDYIKKEMEDNKKVLNDYGHTPESMDEYEMEAFENAVFDYAQYEAYRRILKLLEKSNAH